MQLGNSFIRFLDQRGRVIKSDRLQDIPYWKVYSIVPALDRKQRDAIHDYAMTYNEVVKFCNHNCMILEARERKIRRSNDRYEGWYDETDNMFWVESKLTGETLIKIPVQFEISPEEMLQRCWIDEDITPQKRWRLIRKYYYKDDETGMWVLYPCYYPQSLIRQL